MNQEAETENEGGDRNGVEVDFLVTEAGELQDICSLDVFQGRNTVSDELADREEVLRLERSNVEFELFLLRDCVNLILIVGGHTALFGPRNSNPLVEILH